MKIIVTHLNADFDALASLVAASKLFPAAKVVLPPSMDSNVECFLNVCGNSLMMPILETPDPQKITEVIIVDAAPGSRIGKPFEWIQEYNLPVRVYDHHKPKDMPLDVRYNYLPVGSTTTILVKKLMRKKVKIKPVEATVMLIGIYEDTGHFTYPTTTAEDFRAASFLLSSEADISMIHSFLGGGLDSKQMALLKELINGSEEHRMGNWHITIASASASCHVPNLGMVVHRLRDVEDINVIFAVIEMNNRVHVIARSGVCSIDVSKILAKLGGGGHPSAASVTLKKVVLVEAKEKLKDALSQYLSFPITAKDIMLTHVKSVTKSTEIKDAKELMVRYAVDEMPVVMRKKVVGFMSRHDADRAILHGLGSQKVSDYMSPNFKSVSEIDEVPKIKDSMHETRHAVIPVVNSRNELAGLILKHDLLKILHEQDLGYFLPAKEGNSPVLRDVRNKVETFFPGGIRDILRVAGSVADSMGCKAYIVGGIVRDLLLKVANFDVDIVVENRGVEFARLLARHLKGHAVSHKKFSTAIVVLPSGQKIDVATARTEYYEEPGALPKVEYSSIKHDLYRRDFTINSMAVKINEIGFGELIDFFGGQKDLKDGVVRILNNLSFVDDPTRIFRAVRFEQRYGFKIDRHTKNLIKNAVSIGMFEKVAYERVKNEIVLILSEPKPVNAIRRMAEFNELRFIHPLIRFDSRSEKMFSDIEETLSWYSLSFISGRITSWLVYFLGLIGDLSIKQAEVVCKKFMFSRKISDRIVPIKRDSKVRLSYLSQKKKLKNSEIYFYLNMCSTEILLFLLAKADSRVAKQRIVNYLENLKKVKLQITGKSLIKKRKMPSPKFKEALNKTLAAKLDGKVETKEQELNYALNVLKE